MKKIVGILAGAAVLASSVFALDASAAIKFNGSLFDLSFADGAKPTAIKLEEPKAQKGHGQTGIDLNVSTDLAGATLIIGNGYGGNNNISYQGYKLWVKPADAVKVNFGMLDYCLNKESIDYAGCINGTGSEGIAADITVNALTINLILNPGFNNPWFDGSVIGNTAVMAKYAADFGTIGVAFIGEPQKAVAAKAASFKFDEATGTIKAVPAVAAAEGKSFAKNTISVGYSNNFDAVSMFADVAMVLTTELTNIKADAFAKGSVDAFSYAAYADFDFDVKASKVDAIDAKAKLSYALDACTPYLYVKGDNIQKDVEITVKPGVNFNIGAAGVEIAAEVKIPTAEGAKGSLSVPFGVNLGF